ncbi:MAG TPA: signal peptide peptidase SppA [Rhizomicrobium sp.]|jgi:protease-4|nr:signal peptide peptidase SppA [Rhizomicrobium sp.]
MIGFLRWMRRVALGTLNGIAMLTFFVVLVVGALFLVGLIEGDGLPSQMVLNLDLRTSPPDSSHAPDLFFERRTPPVMDTVLALDRAGRDSRVKGVFLQLGGGLSVAQAEEIGAALIRFRATGRFVIAYAQGFNDSGLGDYLTAASADQIWMEPKSPFSAAGTGAGAIFLRGLFDKIQAVPQIVKRSDYKSAADMYMEKGYTGPDREQTTAFLQSWYNSAVRAVAAERKLNSKNVVAFLQSSPQFAEDAKRVHLIDELGFDDQAKKAARDRAGRAKLITMGDYARATEDEGLVGHGPQVALIEAAGEIVDGSADHGSLGGSQVIASDDYAEAFRKARRDSGIKAILFRIDSPGGSVTASAQILEAVKEAQAAGKPVIVSMGPLAASGGYFVSCSADKIVAEPATLTGSIGVLTGKVSFGKSLTLIGVGAADIGVGNNALFDSAVEPFTPEQLANLNGQADVIYMDFKQKVAQGRKLTLAQVETIAKGRVWTGADARPRGLVDDLGTFWTAVGAVKTAIGVSPDVRLVFKQYPEKEGFFEALADLLSGSATGIRAAEGLSTLMRSPAVSTLANAIQEAPRGQVELRSTNLPGQ